MELCKQKDQVWESSGTRRPSSSTSFRESTQMNLLDTTATERAVALRDVLVEKGLINAGAAEEMAANAEVDWTDRNGARVVARAWTNEDFRRRLLADGT